MAIQLKNPESDATSRQLYKLHKLTGRSIEELESMNLNMQDASDRIDELENPRMTNGVKEEKESGYKRPPFSEAHVTIIEGDQRAGKSNTAVGMISDAYDNDCARVFCEEVLKIKCKVINFNRRSRKGKVLYKGRKRTLRVPQKYELHSPMRIFSNIHLYGMPYRYCPTFGDILAWLKAGIIKNGWLLIDESYIGMNARAGMTAFGKEIQKEAFQFAKSQLDVIIISHLPRLIDWTLRTIPTTHIVCSYNKKTRTITAVIKKRGEAGSRGITFDATQYWGKFKTLEKVTG